MLPAAPGKTFWCQLVQAEWVQNKLGLEVFKHTEDAQLVQRVVRQQILCDTGAAPKTATIKWWTCFTAKPDYCLIDICKEDGKDFIKCKHTNKLHHQTPSFSVSVQWESFSFHEWWLKASSCKQLSELNGWVNSLMLAARTRWRKRSIRKRGAMFKNKQNVSQLPSPQLVEGGGGGSRLWRWKAMIVQLFWEKRNTLQQHP